MWALVTFGLVAYQGPTEHACGTAGRGAFTTALELQEQQRLVLSFMHHMAVQRLCKNPFEEENVVGITNYVNIGLQARSWFLLAWVYTNVSELQ